MIVVFDLAVVVGQTAERPVRLPAARMLTEYRGAGLLYVLRAQEDPANVHAQLDLIHLRPIPVLASLETPEDWTKVVEQNRCSQPGVCVSLPSSPSPPGWGQVFFHDQKFHTLVQDVWNAAPARPVVEEGVA